MPTYSYHCASCGHDFDQVQRINDEPTRTCTACGDASAARVINSANFILKGSGWYADAYSSGSNTRSAGSGGGCASAGSCACAAAASSDN